MKHASNPRSHSIADRARDGDGITAAIARAQRAALREHALAGRKVPIWRDGRVVWVLPTTTGDISPDSPVHLTAN